MRIIEVSQQIFIGPLIEFQYYQRELLLFAQRIQSNAQAPYSNFKVGAAVRNVGGGMSLGVNVERATYTQTTHAEQNAVDSLITKHGPGGIDTVAICAINGKGIEKPLEEIGLADLPFPCGHCLQIIWENCLAGQEAEIFTYLGNGLAARAKISSLLPLRFGPSNLGVDVFASQKPQEVSDAIPTLLVLPRRSG